MQVISPGTRGLTQSRTWFPGLLPLSFYVSIRLHASIDVCIHPFIRPRDSPPDITEYYTDWHCTECFVQRYRVRSSTSYWKSEHTPDRSVKKSPTTHSTTSNWPWQKDVSKCGYITLLNPTGLERFWPRGLFIAGHLRCEVLLYRVVSSPSHLLTSMCTPYSVLCALTCLIRRIIKWLAGVTRVPCYALCCVSSLRTPWPVMH